MKSSINIPNCSSVFNYPKHIFLHLVIIIVTFVSSEVFTDVMVWIVISWVLTSCNHLDGY